MASGVVVTLPQLLLMSRVLPRGTEGCVRLFVEPPVADPMEEAAFLIELPALFPVRPLVSDLGDACS